MSPGKAGDAAGGFYDALAPVFDVLTDWEARLAAEGPFLTWALEQTGGGRVLDAACGSGGHALWLAERGFGVVGADASPGMIDLARTKARARGLEVPFAVARLDRLARASGPEAGHLVGGFDAVLCLGNSLPHLLGPADLAAALAGMADVLRPGGLLVLQDLNYDLRWRTRPRWFGAQGGDTGGGQVLVWRFADYDAPPGLIAFHVAVFRRPEVPSAAGGGPHVGLGADWAVEVHTTPQRPVFHHELADALAAAGFQGLQTYGGMALPAEPFDPGSSPDLVMVARKGAPV